MLRIHGVFSPAGVSSLFLILFSHFAWRSATLLKLKTVAYVTLLARDDFHRVSLLVWKVAGFFEHRSRPFGQMFFFTGFQHAVAVVDQLPILLFEAIYLCGQAIRVILDFGIRRPASASIQSM